MFSQLLTGGETALWRAAHNVLIQQLTNRYGHYAIKGLLVPYSAQVLLFWLMRGKIMCIDIKALTRMLSVHGLHPRSDNTFIFRTALCCRCCTGKMAAVKNDPLINNNPEKATSHKAEWCGRRRKRKLLHLCGDQPWLSCRLQFNSQTDWGTATKIQQKATIFYSIPACTGQSAKHCGYTDMDKYCIFMIIIISICINQWLIDNKTLLYDYSHYYLIFDAWVV